MYFGSLSFDGTRSGIRLLLETALTRSNYWNAFASTQPGLSRCRLTVLRSRLIYEDDGPSVTWELARELGYLIAVAAVSARLEVASADWRAAYRHGKFAGLEAGPGRSGMRIEWSFERGFLPHPDGWELRGILRDLALSRAPLVATLRSGRVEMRYQFPRGLEDAVRERDHCRVNVGPMLKALYRDDQESAELALRPCRTGPIDLEMLVNGWRCCQFPQSHAQVKRALRKRKLPPSCIAEIHLKLRQPAWMGSVKDEERGPRAFELLGAALASMA